MKSIVTDIRLDIVGKTSLGKDENAKEGGNLMFELIHELYTILNKIKGFEAGYNSSVDNRIIIDYKTKRYIITLDEIENPSSDMTDDMKRFA